ncbi:hypothetical protein U0070_017739 [Myodes glareolus]|uniref:Uncharacterized protein n=1 Tax=Myodes glareolus TaxID=447135 RepID=A0AAW0HTJ7_MYOGA
MGLLDKTIGPLREEGHGPRGARCLSDAAVEVAVARSGCCSGDLPHSDSPPTQHRPCAKPAGQRPSIAP